MPSKDYVHHVAVLEEFSYLPAPELRSSQLSRAEVPIGQLFPPQLFPAEEPFHVGDRWWTMFLREERSF